jgi:hypothetical protein
MPRNSYSQSFCRLLILFVFFGAASFVPTLTFAAGKVPSPILVLPSATPIVAATPLPTPSESPLPAPVATPVPSATPSPLPLPSPVTLPTPLPAPVATPVPSATPSPLPFATPEPAETLAPTPTPLPLVTSTVSTPPPATPIRQEVATPAPVSDTTFGQSIAPPKILASFPQSSHAESLAATVQAINPLLNLVQPFNPYHIYAMGGFSPERTRWLYFLSIAVGLAGVLQSSGALDPLEPRLRHAMKARNNPIETK